MLAILVNRKCVIITAKIYTSRNRNDNIYYIIVFVPKVRYTLCSVCKKLQATRAKVAPVNLIYGSHFSATEATYKVSQNTGNFVEFTKTFTRITHKPVPV